MLAASPDRAWASATQTTEPSIPPQPLRAHLVDRCGVLPVPELAEVVIGWATVGFRLRVARPAEEDVARGLHELLAFDHTPTRVLELARTEVRLEDRRRGFLELQEQGFAVARLEEEDPAPRADTPDADDLVGEIDDRIGVEDVLQRSLHREAAHDSRRGTSRCSELVSEEVGFGTDDEWRVGGDDPAAVDDFGELRRGV